MKKETSIVLGVSVKLLVPHLPLPSGLDEHFYERETKKAATFRISALHCIIIAFRCRK